MIQALTDISEFIPRVRFRRSFSALMRFNLRIRTFVQSRSANSDNKGMEELPKRALFFMRLSVFIGVAALFSSLACAYTLALILSATAAGSLGFGVVLSLGRKKRISIPVAVKSASENSEANKKDLQEVI